MSRVRSEFYLGGEWKEGKESVDVKSPWDESVVGRVSLACESDAEEAIKRAEQSFGETRNLSSQERFDILSNILSNVGIRKDEFSKLIAAEIGKPIRYSRVEVERAMLTLQIAAEESRRIGGEFVPIDLLASTKGRFGVARRFPIGVVLGITPFNFPLNLVVHKLAPAIAAGNSFILKPAPQAPLTSLLLAEVVESSGLPKGAFSVLPCTNSVAEKLVRDDRIRMVSFTGSPPVGWSIKSHAGKKKVVLELGGNAGVIVDRSANVKEAARQNALGAFVSGGQTCIKVQRIYVHEEIYDEYRDTLLRETGSLRSGNPTDNETVVGPLIDRAAVDRVLDWIKEAESHGAKVHCGGKCTGNVIEATILSGVQRSDRVFCNEVFGPVVTLHRFSTIEEAVQGVNDSSFGLQAGIFSNDFDNILYAFNEIETGAVIVNDNPTFRVDNMPYGGIKDSGFGREGVKYAIESMTEPKLLVVSARVS
jgi:acyl-CoA reductase-like NAD-dependent aldehyde dehydrogenase